MAHSTHTHWQMTINNPDDNDLALITAGYEDHIRQLVYTHEVGKEGTPHIQAYIKMKRDCRLTHMRKLFPRGHFKYLDTAEYKLNAQRYAQKTDCTTQSAHVIQNGDPLHSIEGVVRDVCRRIIADEAKGEHLRKLADERRWVERSMVEEDYTMAKIFVSSTYKAMWKEYGVDMLTNIRHTHTHTHTEEQVAEVPTIELFSQEENITNGEGRDEDEDEDEGEDDATEVSTHSAETGSDSDGESGDC